MKTTLTVPQASRLARGRARVMASPVGRRLWQVEGYGWAEAHAPMTREAWLGFLDTQAGKEKKGSGGRPETYLAEVDGRKARVAVPDAIDEEDLSAALKDNLSLSIPKTPSSLILRHLRYLPADLPPENCTKSNESSGRLKGWKGALV